MKKYMHAYTQIYGVNGRNKLSFKKKALMNFKKCPNVGQKSSIKLKIIKTSSYYYHSITTR